MSAAAGRKALWSSHLTPFKATVRVRNVRTKHDLIKESIVRLARTMQLKLRRGLFEYGLQERLSRSPTSAVEYKDTR
jgi:hypothetical protein